MLFFTGGKKKTYAKAIAFHSHPYSVLFMHTVEKLDKERQTGPPKMGVLRMGW